MQLGFWKASTELELALPKRAKLVKGILQLDIGTRQPQPRWYFSRRQLLRSSGLDREGTCHSAAPDVRISARRVNKIGAKTSEDRAAVQSSLVVDEEGAASC